MTRPLSFAEIWDRVAYAPSVLVAANCDAELSPALRLGGPLARIAGCPQATVAILSARPLDELRGASGLDAILVGRNGLEVQLGSGRFVHPNVDGFTPPAWDKGSALKYAQRQLSLEDALVICLGDQDSDEGMFRAFRKSAISVKVGTDISTSASYSVRDGEAACEFLHWVADTLRSARRYPSLLRSRVPGVLASERRIR